MSKPDTPDEVDVEVPCGLYQTREPIPEKVPAGALVFYHNHGEPGPGVYPVDRWQHNKAVFKRTGVLVPSSEFGQTLKPLLAEGFYRVTEAFHCCEQKCRLFEPETLVQLGYDSRCTPILFVPVWGAQGFIMPSRGTRVDEDKLPNLLPLKVVMKLDGGEDSEPALPGTEWNVH